MRIAGSLQETVNTGALYEYLQIGKISGQRLNVVQVASRPLDFHVHEQSDELFYVIEGDFHLETEEEMLKTNAENWR